MREILFRGKRAKIGDWVEGSLIAYPDGDCYIARPSGDPCVLDKFCVDPATVGQFTGLTDKNGKKIFEGDIVRYGMIYDFECYLESLENPDAYDGEVCDHDIEVDVVEWCLGYDYPAFDLKKQQFECNGLSQIMCGDYEYEIIGNIHDNPELLEV